MCRTEGRSGFRLVLYTQNAVMALTGMSSVAQGLNYSLSIIVPTTALQRD